MPRVSKVTSALFGRDENRSALAFGVALALLLSVYFLSGIAERQGWMTVIDGNLHLVVLAVLVIGGGLAAWTAYWNDGLVLSWLFVFALVFGWLWTTFVQEGPVFFDEAIVPLAWAVFSALIVGTVGYVVGRIPHRSPSWESVDESSGWLLRLLVGYDSERSVRWGVLAGGLFVITSGLIYATRPFVALPVEGISLVELFLIGGVFSANLPLGVIVLLSWLGLAMWPAYRKAGLLVSWGVIFAPTFGAILMDFVTDGISGSGPLVDATLAFLLALILALILGTSGFVLGSGFRRLITCSETNPHERDASA